MKPKQRTISVGEDIFARIFRIKSLKALEKGERVSYDEVFEELLPAPDKPKTEKK